MLWVKKTNLCTGFLSKSTSHYKLNFGSDKSIKAYFVHIFLFFNAVLVRMPVDEAKHE
jgi:hypothetical protein